MKPYFEDEKAGIVLYCADNRDVLPELPAGSIDLVFTSPPYNMGNTTGGGMKQYKMGHYRSSAGFGLRGGSGKWKGSALADGYEAYADDMPHAEYVEWQKSFLRECWRTLSPAGAIYYNHKQRILDGKCITPLDYNPGLPLRQIITWARSGGINFNTAFYLPTSEWIVVLAKPDFRLRDKSASGVGDVWMIPQESNNPHPAPFPVALPARAIETTAGKNLLDPFCGSGTSLVAAMRAGRKAIGIERSKEYCDQAIYRLKREAGIASDRPRRSAANKPAPLFENVA